LTILDRREKDKRNAGPQDANSKPRWFAPNSTELAFERVSAGAAGGRERASPRMNSETPMPPIMPVRTGLGKYAA